MSATLAAGLLAQSVLEQSVLAQSVVATAAEGEEAWTPGVLGFLVTLGLVVACIPIFRSMTGKIRGVQHRGIEGSAGEVAEVADGTDGENPPGERVPDKPESGEREPDA